MQFFGQLNMLGTPPAPTLNIRRAERVLLLGGLMLLAVWGAARFHRAVASRAAVARFHGEQWAAPADTLSPLPDPSLGVKVSYRLWSSKRIAAYEESLAQKEDRPIAILRVPKITLEAPVFNDTEELTLNRGVGRIQGTAHVGETGNLGIAGHRDGFFRGLKDIGPGDIVELETSQKKEHYVVEKVQIVSPEDVQVLQPTREPSLTLVTCFPFYYVGSAPQRYIVTASIQNSGQRY
jgi:sortase A